MADNIFKFIFFNENLCILIKISQKFVPKCRYDGLAPNRRQAIIYEQMMAWLTDTYESLSLNELTIKVMKHLSIISQDFVDHLETSI